MMTFMMTIPGNEALEIPESIRYAAGIHELVELDGIVPVVVEVVGQLLVVLERKRVADQSNSSKCTTQPRV